MFELIGFMEVEPGAKEVTILLENPTEYQVGSLDNFDVFTLGNSYKKKDYRDRNHFYGVLGKFNSYFVTLDKPIEREKLLFTEVKKIAEI